MIINTLCQLQESSVDVMPSRRSRLTLRQIEVLAAVAEHSSITHAAEWLRISQPAVSRTIQDIEIETGAVLFDRVPRGTIPTVFGEILVRHARAILSELNHAGEEIEALKGNHRGVVRVGTTPIGASVLLPLATARLVERFPGLSVEVSEASLVNLLSDLRTGSLDLVIAPSGEEAVDPAITSVPLYADELVFVGNADHPLVRLPSVDLAQTLNENWILPPRNNRIWRAMESQFFSVGLEMPRNAVISGSIVLVKAIMMTGNWLTLYPRLIVADDLQAGRFALLATPGQRKEWRVCIYKRVTSARSPATRAMEEALAEVAEALQIGPAAAPRPVQSARGAT